MSKTRGTTNRDARGSTEDRRRRRVWLVATFGDGETCACVFCGCELTVDTVSPDRIVPGVEGGRYTRDNIRPACVTCQSRTGSLLAWERRRARASTSS